LDTVPGGSQDQVVGHPVAYSLPAGTVLTRSSVGAAQVPPPGLGIAAVALKAGQFPTGLAAGSRVVVIVAAGTGQTATATQGAAATSQWDATVVGVAARENDQTTVVSLQMAEADARALAAAPAGQVGIVTVNDAGR
jgi:hypothetical protein